MNRTTLFSGAGALLLLAGCSAADAGSSAASAIDSSGRTYAQYCDPNGVFHVQVPSTWSHSLDPDSKIDSWSPSDYPYPQIQIATRSGDQDSLASDLAVVAGNPDAVILSQEMNATYYVVKFRYGTSYDYHKTYVVNGQYASLDILFDSSVDNSGTSETQSVQVVADSIATHVLDSFVLASR